MAEDPDDSILWGVFEEGFKFDWAFHEHRLGAPKRAVPVLRDFWARPEYQDLARHVAPPDATWDEIQATVGNLLAGAAPQVASTRWGELAAASEQLSTLDALAASIVAIYALAGYQARADRSREGWHRLVPHLARNLLAADAVFSARRLSIVSLLRLQAQLNPSEHPRSVEAYAEVADQAESRLSSAHADLAWHLWRNAAEAGSPLRAEAAALAWATGDVLRSRLMETDLYAPPFPAIHRLVRRSIDRLPTDPLVQFIWLHIKGRDVFPVNEHTLLRARINLVYDTSATHNLEALFGLPLDRLFAQTLVQHFARSLTGETIDAYRRTLGLYNDLLGEFDVRFLVRLVGLHLLLPDADGAAAEWRRLHDLASATARELSRSGELDDYDLVLDIPSYYLEADVTRLLSERAELLEAYRCSCQGYTLKAFPPRPPLMEPEGDEYLQMEQSALQRLRGVRFKARIRQLEAVSQFGDEVFADGGPLDPQLVARELDDAEAALTRTWDALESYAPSYVHVRRNPVVTLHNVAFLLYKHKLHRAVD